MKRAILALVAAVLLLAGCGSGVTRGEVVGKDFSPAHCSVTLVPIFNGKTTSYMPQTVCYPDEWDLELKDCSSGKCETDWLSVGKDIYDATAQGSYFDAEAAAL